MDAVINPESKHVLCQVQKCVAGTDTQQEFMKRARCQWTMVSVYGGVGVGVGRTGR